MQRREFLAGSLATGAGLLLPGSAAAAQPRAKSPTPKGDAKMPFQQPELPYPLDALQPYLDKEQMTFHYTKHQAAYFAKLNTLAAGKPEAEMPLREVVIKSTGPIFNNAAQAWNHTFFWNSMAPAGGGEPKGKLAAALERDFGGVEAFKKAFADAAVNLFGSGWTWLAIDPQGKLHIMPLSNAGTPLKEGREPLLTIDVWEHAYYIDYRNDRARYIQGFWTKVNWDHAAECLAEATKRA